jgi:hypothetical protein
MGGLRLVAVGGNGWKAFVAPALFLLAATLAVVVFRAVRHASPPAPAPAASHVIGSRTPARPAPRFYTVAAGDTLAAIVAKTGVAAARIQALNPGVTPTALFVHEKLRLR